MLIINYSHFTYFLLLNFSYPVAIKCPKNTSEAEIDVFLEEAKSMLEIKAYHENIVNLQGINYRKGRPDNPSTQVRYKNYRLFYYVIDTCL